MKIYLSINNREKVIQLPHLPSEITISKGQSNETYSTVNGELNLIGNLSLETISFSSFFDGWSLVEEIKSMRKRKLPLRLIVTETPINMPVTIDEFEASMRQGKKVWYSITLHEFRFRGGAV